MKDRPVFPFPLSLSMFCAVFLMFCMSFVPALAAQDVRGSITVYGETRSKDSGARREAPGTLSGVVNLVDDVELVVQTETICAELGKSFGLWLDVELPEGTLVVQLESRTEHPPMRAPDGRVSTIQRSMMSSLGGRTYFGWSFDYRWEVVPGPWRMSFHHEGRLIAEKRFDVRTEACYLGS
jgi:hypothetical protein